MNEMTTELPDVRLRFNIDNPSVEECYLYGYECATKDIQEEDNPFESGTLEHRQWADGWWDGFYGTEPLFSTESLYNDEPDVAIVATAANDHTYYGISTVFLSRLVQITSALAVTAVVGYQLLDLVA